MPTSPILPPQYWEAKKLENARHDRRLGESISMGEWILGVRRINLNLMHFGHPRTLKTNG